MQKTCSIFLKSLRFTRTFYGILAITAFLLQDYWIIGLVSVMLIVEIFSVKFSIPYQIHSFFSEKIFKKKRTPQKMLTEQGELSFVCMLAGVPLFISFLLLHFGKLEIIAWGLDLFFGSAFLVAGFIGVCPSAFFYVIVKEIMGAKKESKKE